MTETEMTQDTAKRIQVSCIPEHDDYFPTPRPFSIQRSERRNQSTLDTYVLKSVRFVRAIGFTLIGISVLMLILSSALQLA